MNRIDIKDSFPVCCPGSVRKILFYSYSMIKSSRSEKNRKFNTNRYIYSMDREPSKAERTRQFIIENTAEVFNKKGYAGTSMLDLTEATKLTKGSIYGNFENKEEVALAAFDYNCAKITKLIQDQVDKTTTFHDKLMVYAAVYKKISRESFNRGGCPILNTAAEADDTHFLLKDKAAKAILAWEKNISRLIEAGVKAGEFRKNTPTRQMALSIIALIEGGVMISRATGDTGRMDAVLATVEMLVTQMKK
jgi:TetR/AcrR family transcriptional regulator, transcriptional repressor for nem operon